MHALPHASVGEHWCAVVPWCGRPTPCTCHGVPQHAAVGWLAACVRTCHMPMLHSPTSLERGSLVTLRTKEDRMTSIPATTVQQYLDDLPDERRAVVATVRGMILRHLPAGYQETMRWGKISYEIPLARYPTTYNGQPLGYLALAAQKHYYALYLMGAYADADQEARLKEAFIMTGKKLNMGRSCLRFRTLDDVPLDAIGQVVASTPPEEYIARYEAARQHG